MFLLCVLMANSGAVHGQIILFAGDEQQQDLQGSSNATQQSTTPLFGNPTTFDIPGSANFANTSGGGTTTGGLDEFIYAYGRSSLGASGFSNSFNQTRITASSNAWVDDNAYDASVGSFVSLRSGEYMVRALSTYQITGTGVFAPFHGRRGIYNVGRHTQGWFSISPSMNVETGQESSALPGVQQREWSGEFIVQSRFIGETSFVAPIRMMGYNSGQIDPPIIDSRGHPWASHRSTIDNTRTVQGYHSWGDPNSVERWPLAIAGQTAFLTAGAADGTVAFRKLFTQSGQPNNIGHEIVSVKYNDNQTFEPWSHQPGIEVVGTGMVTGNRPNGFPGATRIASLSEPRAAAELAVAAATLTGGSITPATSVCILEGGLYAGASTAFPNVMLQSGTSYASLPTGITVASIQGTDSFPNITTFRVSNAGTPPSGNAQTWAAVMLAGSGVTTANDGAIVRVHAPTATPFGPVIHAREGTTYAWLPAGATISGFGTLSADGNSGAVCWVTLSGVGIDATNDVALLRVRDSATPVIVFRESDTATDLPAGVTFNLDAATILSTASAFHAPVMNDSLKFAFAAMLRGPGVDGTNDTAIFRGDFTPGFPMTIQKVVRFSEPTPAGGVYRNPVGFVSINTRGQVVFRTGVMTELNEPVNLRPRGIFFWDPNFGMQKVVRSDDLIEIEPGSFVKLQSVDLAQPSSGRDGRGTGLSDSGLLVFRVGYQNGNGIMYFAPRQQI